MKKLFSITTVFLLIFTLSACDLFSNDEEVIEYDNELFISFTNEYDFRTNHIIGYNNDFEGNLFDLLDANFTIGYNETDFGSYIVSIEHLNPKNGAFVSFDKNGALASEGTETIAFEDEDTFDFEVVWYDAFQQSVDDAIHLFLDNYASLYVNSETYEYNVIAALSLLNIAKCYVAESEVIEYVGNSTNESVNDYFKSIIILNSFGVNSDSYIDDLNNIVDIGPYGQTAYGLITLDSYDHSTDYSAYLISALTDFSSNTPYDLGIDAGGISLVALSNHTDELGVQNLITEYTNWISSSILESGGVKTRDMVYGETTYPGTENAASIAQVIIALLANNIDPTGTIYSNGDNNLVTRLIEFQTSTGSFTWGIGEEFDEDLAFSTPQAFLALVVYQTYANTYNAVNPYNFK